MALASSTKINLVNTDASTVYIDYLNIEGGKNKIKKDLANLINEIDAIKKAYKTLANHKSTKGQWKTTAEASVTAATKFHKNLSTISNQLETSINSSVLEYVITQINELMKAQQAAQTINTDAGSVQQ